jgi:hypothetical protein
MNKYELDSYIFNVKRMQTNSLKWLTPKHQNKDSIIIDPNTNEIHNDCYIFDAQFKGDKMSVINAQITLRKIYNKIYGIKIEKYGEEVKND